MEDVLLLSSYLVEFNYFYNKSILKKDIESQRNKSIFNVKNGIINRIDYE